jgi:hypothetical protein
MINTKKSLIEWYDKTGQENLSTGIYNDFVSFIKLIDENSIISAKSFCIKGYTHIDITLLFSRCKYSAKVRFVYNDDTKVLECYQIIY